MNNTTNTNITNNNKIKFPYIKVNIINLGLLILLGIIIYFVYTYIIKDKYAHSRVQFTQNTLLESLNSKEEKLILEQKMPLSLYGNEYNISMWIKVLNYDYRLGMPKYILRKGDLEVYLHPTQNNLHIGYSKDKMIPTSCDDTEDCDYAPAETTTTQPLEDFNDNNDQAINKTKLKCINNTNICSNTVSYKHNPLLDKVLSQYKKAESFKDEVKTTIPIDTIRSDECIYFDLPIQKWTHISINFFSDNIDIFIDGKLVSSCNLDIVPDFKQSNMIIAPNGGFDGKIVKVIYTNIKLSTNQVYKLYKQGPL